jgi:hypothetical protein
VRVSLSRRQFFRRLVKPGEKTRDERSARYEAMAAYVRTNLLPYDFGLTEAQEAELFAAVRSALEETGDEELFSAIIRFKVDEVVDSKIRPWREASYLDEEGGKLRELRRIAVDYVNLFLNGQGSPTTIEQLQQKLAISDIQALEFELRNRIQEWVHTVDDSELLKYDVVTVKDLVFDQLRSWC